MALCACPERVVIPNEVRNLGLRYTSHQVRRTSEVRRTYTRHMQVRANSVSVRTLFLLSTQLTPAYVLFAISIPFVVACLRDRTRRPLLIAGGIMAITGWPFS